MDKSVFFRCNPANDDVFSRREFATEVFRENINVKIFPRRAQQSVAAGVVGYLVFDIIVQKQENHFSD